MVVYEKIVLCFGQKTLTDSHYKTIFEKVSIPVGCVACLLTPYPVVSEGVVCLRGGVCLQGVSHHTMQQTTPPPLNKMTDKQV